MSKRDRTRKLIIEKAANLFNTKGYAGTSIQDIMQATGLKKGGIYGNFKKGKIEIAVEAFDYSVNLVTDTIRAKTIQKQKSYEKLLEAIDFYRAYLDEPPVEGGCPILNIAPEVDDTNAALRNQVIKAYDNWRYSVASVIEKGIKKGEIKAVVNPQEFATVFITMLEGGILMSRSYNKDTYLQTVLNRLEKMVREELIIN